MNNTTGRILLLTAESSTTPQLEWFRAMEQYWTISVTALGVLGNFLMILTLSNKKMRHFPSAPYFISMAVFDTFWLVNKFSSLDLATFDNSNAVVCKLWTYLVWTCLLASPWILVFVTLDRLVCVCFPIKSRLIPMRFRGYVIITLIVTGLIVNVPFLVFADINNIFSGPACGEIVPNYNDFGRSFRFYKSTIYFTLRIITDNVIPCIFLLLFDVAYVINFNNRRKQKKIITSSSKSHKDKNLTILVFASSLVFIIIQIPSTCTYFISLWIDYSYTVQAVTTLTAYLTDLVPASNFYIYMLTGARARQILVDIIKCN